MITVHVDFDHTFHGRSPGRKVEWPPAPARVLAALLAGCYNACLPPEQTQRVREGLEEVEKSNAPVVYTEAYNRPTGGGPDQVVSYTRGKVGATDNKGKWLPEVAIKFATYNHPMPVVATRVSYLVDVNEELAECLDVAAAAVSYLGTSVDSCSITVVPGADLMDAGAHRWEPVRVGQGDNRGWYTGLCAELDNIYRAENGTGALAFTRSDVPLTYRCFWGTDDLLEGEYVVLRREYSLRATRFIDGELNRLRGVVRGELLPLVNADPVHGNGALMGVAVRDIEDAMRLLNSETGVQGRGVGYEMAEQDSRWWLRVHNYVGPASTWRTVLPVYAPTSPKVAGDYLAYCAAEAGARLVSYRRTDASTRGCARFTMPVHPRGFTPYEVVVEVADLSRRPVLSRESLLVPVTESKAMALLARESRSA